MKILTEISQRLMILHIRIEVFKRIKEINQSGNSILLVEQNVTEASELADRIYVVEDGRIIFGGSKRRR